MKSLLKLGAALLLFSALETCSNPFDIVNSVKTDVMVANKKYLVIQATGPSVNNQNVRPCDPIWLQFDRDVDTSTVSDQTITISPAITWTSDFNSATKTLTITPTMLDILTPYTLTVNGVKGSDGSDLQTPYTLAFKTANGPSGTLATTPHYTNSSAPTVTLTFTVNSATWKYRWSDTESQISSDPNYGAPWSIIGSASPTYTVTGSDGVKNLYYQLLDSNNNLTPGYNAATGTHPLTGTVVYDNTAPTPVSFTINKGALAAPRTLVVLYPSATDALSPIEVHFKNQAAGSSWSSWTNLSSGFKWGLSSPGTRQVWAEFRDKAGNVSATQLHAEIIAGAPTMYSYVNDHGHAGIGNTYQEWTVNAPDVGTDKYHVSWRFHSGGNWYDYITVTVPHTTLPTVTETILDYAVQIENTTVGWAGSAATTYSNAVPTFTSNVVIIYNDADSTDTNVANTIYGVLKNNPEWKNANAVSGTFPSVSVARVPESLVSTTYADHNRIWGYPVIVTPGVTNYSSAGWVQNIAGAQRGLVLMGYPGAYMLDLINSYWGSWGLGGQQPNQIGLSYSTITGPDAFGYARIVGVNVWTTPLYRSAISDQTRVLIGNSLARVSINLGSAVPTGGYVFCTDDTNRNYVNTVQQGRFVQYGFYGLAGVGYPAWLYSFWVNLINHMGEANY